MVEQRAAFMQSQSKGSSELQFKKKLAFIFRNWKFDKCKADLVQKQIPYDGAKDLPQAASKKEEQYMTDLFTEYYGINATTYVDLSSSTDPHDQLETKLKDIVQNTLLPSYNNKEHVLLVFYFTGHGYADEQKRSQILLNMPIQKHRKGRKFLNPYRIEEKLIDIWNAYYNVCIELIVDACREKNRFEEHFKKINLEIPLTDTMPLLYNTMGGKLEDGTSRETNKPWPSEADDKRVNNFFARNYACQYGELTDAIPTKGYAQEYASHYRVMHTKRAFVSMPGHFLPTNKQGEKNDDQFKRLNKLSESMNDFQITHRSEVTESVKLNTEIRHISLFAVAQMHQVPEQKVESEIEKQERLDLLKDLEEEFKEDFGKTDFDHRRVFFKVPKKILAEFAKQVLTYKNLSTVHSDGDLVIAPMNISESFLSLQEDKVLIVFDSTDIPDPEAEHYKYSVQCIKAHEDVSELSRSLEKLGPETKIVGGYLEKNTGYIVFLTRSKDGAGKKVYHQHAGNAQTRYELISDTWENQTVYAEQSEHPICAFIQMNTDNFLAIRDKKDPRRGDTGFFSLHKVLGAARWQELKRKFGERKSDSNTICSKELTELLQNGLSGEVHEEIHIDSSLHDNILQGFATYNRDLDKTKLYTFVPKKK